MKVEKYLRETKIDKDLMDDVLSSGESRVDNIKTNIDSFIKNFINESQKVNKYIEKHIKKYNKDYGNVSETQLKLIIMQYLKDGPWGNDKMLPLLAEIIALGRYVY